MRRHFGRDFGAFCGFSVWRRAAVFSRRLRFAADGRAHDAGGFHFLRRLWLAAVGRAMRAVFIFCGVCGVVRGWRRSFFIFVCAMFAFVGGRAFFFQFAVAFAHHAAKQVAQPLDPLVNILFE